VAIRAADIGLSATVEFDPTSMIVRNGAAKDAQVRLRAETSSLIELAEAPSVLGVPNPLSASGRHVLRLIARKRIRIDGALRHPLVLLRFSRLMGAV
jgi:hypothetical protein